MTRSTRTAVRQSAGGHGHQDARFAEQAPTLGAWSEPLLDVDRSAAGTGDCPRGRPPAARDEKQDAPATSQLAEELAERGSVVAVANWHQLEDPAEEFTDADVLSSSLRPGSRWPPARSPMRSPMPPSRRRPQPTGGRRRAVRRQHRQHGDPRKPSPLSQLLSVLGLACRAWSP